MKTKTKVKIHQFDPVIYPYKIWVVVNSTPNIIAEQFLEYKGENILFSEEDDFDRTEAFTMMVRHKKSKCYGSIVYFRSIKNMTYKIVAHESCHTAKDLFKHIGADVDPHEPFEYVVGFIADCCNQVRINKFK